MNGTRRVLLACYSVLLIAAAGGLMALTWNESKQLDLNVNDFNMTAAITASDTAKWIVTAILAGVALVGLITLAIAIARPGRRMSKGTLRMRQADGGTVEVGASAVEAILREELERLPDVRQVDPRVRLSGGAVDTDMDVVLEPTANIANATSSLTQATAQALREQVGVTDVRRPVIRINYADDGRPAGMRGRPKDNAAVRVADRPLPAERPTVAERQADETMAERPEAEPEAELAHRRD